MDVLNHLFKQAHHMIFLFMTLSLLNLQPGRVRFPDKEFLQSILVCFSCCLQSGPPVVAFDFNFTILIVICC